MWSSSFWNTYHMISSNQLIELGWFTNQAAKQAPVEGIFWGRGYQPASTKGVQFRNNGAKAAIWSPSFVSRGPLIYFITPET